MLNAQAALTDALPLWALALFRGRYQFLPPTQQDIMLPREGRQRRDRLSTCGRLGHRDQTGGSVVSPDDLMLGRTPTRPRFLPAPTLRSRRSARWRDGAAWSRRSRAPTLSKVLILPADGAWRRCQLRAAGRWRLRSASLRLPSTAGSTYLEGPTVARLRRSVTPELMSEKAIRKASVPRRPRRRRRPRLGALIGSDRMGIV